MSDFLLWNEDKLNLQLQKANEDVNSYIMDISKKKRLGFSYRKEQHKFALDVMNAIKNNYILLIQAGVGTGKSMGYIIPIIATFNNSQVFKKVVISTSNIALQQQLLTDFNYISKLLGVDIKVEIAKGLKNYACIKKINELSNTKNTRFKKVLNDLENEIINKNSVDRSDLGFIEDYDWERIQLNKRSECSNCNYSMYCLYRQHVSALDKSDVVITNHAYFANASSEDNKIITDSDMYVFDEAHELENSIRGVNQNIIKLYDIKKDLYYFSDNNYISFNDVNELAININKLFYKIMCNSKGMIASSVKEENFSFTDCNRVPIDIKRINHDLVVIIKKFAGILKVLSKDNYLGNNWEAKNVMKRLVTYCSLFVDLRDGKNSNNIYWAEFFKDDKINFGYVSKDDYVSVMNVFKRNVPIIFTSATMLDANGSYNYFKEGLHFGDMDLSNRTLVDGRVYPSPFNYYTNSIFYYDDTISSPYSTNYVSDLIDRIYNLINITEGKTLVLFTAKSTMNKVYSALSKMNLKYNLLVQGMEDNNVLLDKFSNDVNSCLFATGSFWEGIDVKGEALSNVIITRLPFPVVDAVTQFKASKYSKDDEFKMVYLNDMVQKIAQGSGRLIRNKNDYGIVCCLDSRCGKYLDYIKKCVPFEKYTNDINSVIKFSDKKIKKLSKKQEN